MPSEIQDDNDPTLSSSDEVNQDAAGTLTEDAGTGSDPSAGQDVAEDRGALDVVEDVVKARQPEAGSSPEAEQDGKNADPKGKQGAKERDDENYTDVGFHKHPRFQQLLREKKAATNDAGHYRNLTGFFTKHGVNAEEASAWVRIAGFSKTNPVEAWKLAKPFIQQLLIDAGEVLPAALKARVESGELSVEAANEIARAEAGRVSVERQREIDEQERERTAEETRVKGLRDAASAWEADREAKDPNWAAKKEAVEDKLFAIHRREGAGDTPAKVKDQLDRAYKAVSTAAVPARRAAPPAPTVGQATRQRTQSNGQGQSRPAADEPTGALKFIKRVVENRGAAA